MNSAVDEVKFRQNQRKQQEFLKQMAERMEQQDRELQLLQEQQEAAVKRQMQQQRERARRRPEVRGEGTPDRRPRREAPASVESTGRDADYMAENQREMLTKQERKKLKR